MCFYWIFRIITGVGIELYKIGFDLRAMIPISSDCSEESNSGIYIV